MALVSVTLFTACSSDDDDAVTPVFPQVQTIAGAAGAELDFTFDANESWSLSSDKIWCKLIQGEKADAFVINGTAGKQTIKVKITDDDASNDKSVAQLFLSMGGQKVAIAEVTRSAAGYKLQVFDAAGNDITKTGITVGYKDIAGQPIYNKFSVKSTYRFAVTNTPAWVELEGGFLVGTPNKDAVGGVAFKENQGVSAKYAIANDGTYNITFTSEDGKGVETVPVIFEGMPEDMMEITYPNDERKVSQWNVWNVSLDGKVFTQNGSSLNGGDTNDFTFHNFVPFTLKTFGDDYQLVVFEKKEDGLFEDTSGAVKLQGEKGDVKLTIDALNSGSREFLVYALPQGVYADFENGLDEMLENDFTTVKSDYDRYFLMDVVQKETSSAADQSAAPTILKMNYLPVECKKDKSMYGSIISEAFGYNGDEIYVAQSEVGSSLTVNPNIKDWDPTTMMETGYLTVMDSNGKEVYAEPSMDENNNWVFFVNVPASAPMFMVFKDNGTPVKVLVVEPLEEGMSKKHTSIRKIRK